MIIIIILFNKLHVLSYTVYIVGQLCINALMMSHISVKEYFLPPPMQYIIHMQAR